MRRSPGCESWYRRGCQDMGVADEDRVAALFGYSSELTARELPARG
jgi:hypothetical protein